MSAAVMSAPVTFEAPVKKFEELALAKSTPLKKFEELALVKSAPVKPESALQLKSAFESVARVDDETIRQLTGTWGNQLNSVMRLTADREGFLSGTYESGVGAARGRYILTGRFDTQRRLRDQGISLAWSVSWQNDQLRTRSTTGWSGQFFPGASPQIRTMWLLTRSTSPNDAWGAVQVGQDMFTPVRPNPALEEVDDEVVQPVPYGVLEYPTSGAYIR